MNNPKKLKGRFPAFKVNMGGIFLDQALPNSKMDQIDPFLLVHHLELSHPKGSLQKDVGVGPHPHRGFAPVSFVFKGAIHHRDSRNHSSVVEAGGTQWMHSGRGIVHSERPSKEVAESGASWEIIQFWVNSPAKFKMVEPFYKALSYEDTPVVQGKDGLSEVGIVCGEFLGKKGAINNYTELIALRFSFEEGAKLKIPIPSNFNGFIYQLDGKLNINGTTTSDKDMTVFENEGVDVSIEALSKGRAILLAGMPINEELATYGPFVMNTQTEIMQAMRDYQMGKMGVLVEEFE